MSAWLGPAAEGVRALALCYRMRSWQIKVSGLRLILSTLCGSALAVFAAPLVTADPTEAHLPVFTDITSESDVRVSPQVSKDTMPFEMAFVHGSMTIQHNACVALEDLNGDGHLDLVVCDRGRLHLFQGDGAGRLTAIESLPVLPLRDAHHVAHGIAIGDLNGDGRVDMYVSVANGPNHLFMNEGSWAFSEVAETAGVNYHGLAYSTNMVDYDNDGNLDLFVCYGGVFFNDRLNVNLQVPGKPNQDGGSYSRQRNVLYRNNGDGTFTDVTVAAGLEAADMSLASSFADYDRDGDQDLFIANDVGVNRFYRNNGDGTFTELTAEMGYLDPGPGMSVMWGDVNNDGRLDLLVGNMYSHSANRLITENYAKFSELPPMIRTVVGRGVSGNALLIQQSDGTFTNEAQARGVHDASWAWGSVFADFNNDGWLDMYVANGWTRGVEPTDYCSTIWSGLFEGLHRVHASSWSGEAGARPTASTAGQVPGPSDRQLETLWRMLSPDGVGDADAGDLERARAFFDAHGNLDIDTSHIPRIGDISWDGYNANRLFINPGAQRGPFVQVTDSPVVSEDISKTIATGDIDHDGDVDLVVVSTTSPVKIFRNDSPARTWLLVELEGLGRNRSAIGAQVAVRTGDRQIVRSVESGSGFCSHQSLELEFGLGEVEVIDELEIRWPSGRVQRILEPPINTRLRIREEGSDERS